MIILCVLLMGGHSCCLAFSLFDKATPSKTTKANAASFWNGPLPSLTDPPSPKLLDLIKESPYRGGFEPAADNIEPYAPTVVQGSIPPDLNGSLATNGPGRIRIGEKQYGHWFDGDGYVTLLSFRDGEATFRARYVRTKRFKAQEQLMKKHGEDDSSPPLAFSGAWTPAGRGRWYENILRFPTNPANTATMWLTGGPRLFALCEGGHPVELDPNSLDTIGPETPFRGPNGKVASFFSAHFSRDVDTGNIYNHGYILNPGPGPARLNLMKLSSDGTLLMQRHCDLPFDTFVHDLILSQTFAVYFLPPFYNSGNGMWRFLLGLSPIGKLFEWHPQCFPTCVHVHSKENLKKQWCIKLSKITTLYHLVDAHDQLNQNGTVTLCVRVAEHVPPGRKLLEEQFANQYAVKDGTRLYTMLREYTFHLGLNGEVLGGSDRDVCRDAALCEFPVINTEWKPNEQRQYCWTNALSSESENYLNGIQKIDMEHERASPVVTFGEFSPLLFQKKEPSRKTKDTLLLQCIDRWSIDPTLRYWMQIHSVSCVQWN